MQNSEILFLCGIIYFAVCLRWFLVILKYHKDVLAEDSSYEYSDHWLFKTILFLRALVLAVISPVIAFLYPPVLNQFINGCGSKKDDQNNIASFQEIDE